MQYYIQKKLKKYQNNIFTSYLIANFCIIVYVILFLDSAPDCEARRASLYNTVDSQTESRP